jgi:hypothetical protein
MAIKHLKVSSKADTTDSSLIRPSDWNAEHTGIPDTIANILTDHDKSTHDAMALDHTSLTNKGTNTHNEIDSHILATANVHNFDISGNAPAQAHGNEKHSLTYVPTNPPVDKKKITNLYYNTASGEIEFEVEP